MKRKKKVKYKDNWVLHHDLVEIHWVNDVAVAVRFHGATFLAKHTVPVTARKKFGEPTK